MAYKSSSVNLFPRLSTLDTFKISAEKLIIALKEDKRHPDSILQRFIYINRRSFDYLGIKPLIEHVDYRFNLVLVTSKNIGAAPIFSTNHKPLCDITVGGRYNEEVGELLPLLGDYISPEYSDKLVLNQATQQTPPIYLECCRFVDKYFEAKRYNWQKFSTIVQEKRIPSSGTDWSRYAINAAESPKNIGIFHNSCNILTTEHPDWQKLNYVLKIALGVLSSHTTPIRARAQYNELINTLSRSSSIKIAVPTDELKYNASDPAVIKELKVIGNLILQGHVKQSTAWRMDYAEFFERFVQFLFVNVAKRKGYSAYNNEHYSISGKSSPRWGLSYLEPDLVLQKDNIQYVIDAKYKSHIFNWREASDELSSTFRHDLHQIVAYSSFSQNEHRNTMIVYPFNEFFHKALEIRSPFSSTKITVNLVGIPIEKKMLNNTIENLSSIVI